MSETDTDFMKRMESYVAQSIWQDSPDFVRLFALARRGAAMADWERRTRALLGDPSRPVTMPTFPPPPKGAEE